MNGTATTPNFVFIAPNECHDMHGISSSNANSTTVNIPDCAYASSGLDHKVIALGDKYLRSTVAAILASPAWNEGSVLLIPWDEDDYAGTAGCCGSPVGQSGAVLGGANAPLIVITSAHAQAQTDATAYNHYSLLATIEKVWGLPCLANACTAPTMTKLFQP